MKFKNAFTPEEVAEQLGVTKETVLGWRELGMPWVQLGKKIYILESSFMKWVMKHEVHGNAQDAPEQDFFGKPISEHRPREN